MPFPSATVAAATSLVQLFAQQAQQTQALERSATITKLLAQVLLGCAERAMLGRA